MKKYKRRDSYPLYNGLLLPILGIVAFTALGYFIGDSIRETHYAEVQKQLELKVENLEQQLEFYRSEVGLASSIDEPDFSIQYRLTNQSDPNQATVSSKRLTWPLKYRPYFRQAINDRQQ